MSAVQTLETFAQRSGVFELMNTAWAWPIAESLHFMGLSLLIGSVGVVDLRMLGLARSIPFASLHRITRWGVAGFALNALTGAAFFVSDPGQYLYNPAFQLKAACIAIAAINVIAFYAAVFPRMRAADCIEAPLPAKMVAAVSLASWLSVISFGRLITFYRPPEHWCFWC
jgi:hypothetical protein